MVAPNMNEQWIYNGKPARRDFGVEDGHVTYGAHRKPKPVYEFSTDQKEGEAPRPKNSWRQP